VLADLGQGKPQIILMASGSEVQLVVEAGKRLAESGIRVRVVSFPSWELFAAQDEAYQAAVLPPDVDLRVSVEAGVSQGWHRWGGTKGRVIALDRYGVSAPGKVAFENLGFTAAIVEQTARELLGE
jgi:transketolase